ncbi:MAG: hypothetical protein VYB66_02675 [Verrucomicrobiota bacterium]|nr:hypothetical protein [Verrucomicrobiota bacterium]
MTINETNTQPDLLPSLARVVHGTSVLFWGLPFAMVISIMATVSNWTDAVWPLGMLLPPVAFGMLWYGLWLLRSFQPQERIWQEALGEVKLLGLFNLGLSPFLHWHHRAPDELGFANAVWLLALVSVFYLISLNKMLSRLAAMLPDETLRVESKLFSRMNCVLLAMAPIVFGLFHLISLLDEPPELLHQLLNTAVSQPWFYMVFVLAFMLIPLSMTMSLLWKTKESILASVFHSPH